MLTNVESDFFEFMYPKFIAVINFAMLLTLLFFRSIYVIPIAVLFAVAVAFRTSFWFQYKFFARGIGAIIIGVLVLLWYFYGIISG